MKDSFIFYKSFYDAISLLGEKAQLKLYQSIMKLNYNQCKSMTEVMQLCNDIESTLQRSRSTFAQWLLIKPQLLANIQRYENGCKGKDYGKLGGAPKGNSNASKNNPKTTPKQPLICNVNENVNENNKEKKETDKEKKSYDNPSLEDVTSYFSFLSRSKGEAEKFWQYYEAIGWIINGNPIINWKMAANRWMKNSRNIPVNTKTGKKWIDKTRTQISDTEDRYDYYGKEKKCPHNAPPRPDFEYGWYGGKWITNAHYNGDF